MATNFPLPYPQIEFPYTNVHQLNLDWVLKILKQMLANLNSLAETVDDNAEKIVQLRKDLDNLVSTIPGLIKPAVADEIRKLLEDGTLADLINTTLFDELAAELEDRIKALENNALNEAFPKVQHYGNQIGELVSALGDPFFQFVGLVLVGDSITWGIGSTGIADTEPHTRQITDARNNATSPSYANLFREWLPKVFMNDPKITLSNDPFSPSGDSITTAVSEITTDVYPSSRVYGAIVTPEGKETELQTPGNLTGSGVTLGLSELSNYSYFYTLSAIASAADKVYLHISNFTGKSITVLYNQPANDAAAPLVQVYNGNTLLAEALTNTPEGGINVPLTFNFDFVKNTAITIRVVPRDGATTGRLRITGLRISKTLRISNQGISGCSWMNYTPFCLENSISGSPVGATALHYDDSFVTVMLGTNDAIVQELNRLERDVDKFLQSPYLYGASVILMTPPARPVLGTSRTPIIQVRNFLLYLAEKHNIDIVDIWYSIYQKLPLCYGADTVHPNNFGHALIFNSLKNAIMGD